MSEILYNRHIKKNYSNQTLCNFCQSVKITFCKRHSKRTKITITVFGVVDCGDSTGGNVRTRGVGDGVDFGVGAGVGCGVGGWK